VCACRASAERLDGLRGHLVWGVYPCCMGLHAGGARVGSMACAAHAHPPPPHTHCPLHLQVGVCLLARSALRTWAVCARMPCGGLPLAVWGRMRGVLAWPVLLAQGIRSTPPHPMLSLASQGRCMCAFRVSAERLDGLRAVGVLGATPCCVGPARGGGAHMDSMACAAHAQHCPSPHSVP
jgi:hypothetical protein